MITDEMILEAQIAVATAMVDSGAEKTARGYASAALTAAYPLIRDAVLEEAARIVSDYADIENHSHNESGSTAACYAAATLRDVEQAIRDMKGNKNA